MFSIQLGRWDRFQSLVTIYRGSSDKGWIICFSIFNKLIWPELYFLQVSHTKEALSWLCGQMRAGTHLIAACT